MSWIYKEFESWIVCKIYFILVLFGVSGYFGIIIFLVFVLYSVVFFVFCELYVWGYYRNFLFVIVILGIFLVLFWMFGISKDMLLSIGFNMVIVSYFKLFWIGFWLSIFFILLFFSIVFLYVICYIMLIVVFLLGIYFFLRSWLWFGSIFEISKISI